MSVKTKKIRIILIKNKDNIYFSKNIRHTKRLKMNELTAYNTTPERNEEKDTSSAEDDDEKYDFKHEGKHGKTLSHSSDSEQPVPKKMDIHMSHESTSSASSTTSSIPPSSITKSRIQEAARDFGEQCKYIPMRLTEEERRLLNVLENALEVCEYTDTVDVAFSHTGKSKQSRIIASLVDILSITGGLLMANNLIKGESLLAGKSLTDNVPLFAQIFEIGRRYKIMNPGKMRNTYGKLMWILMDTESYHIKSELKLNFIDPVQTVGLFLKERGARHLLQDPLLAKATSAVNTGDKSKADFIEESKVKGEAASEIMKTYTSSTLTENDLQRILDSIADNEAYLSFNVLPVDKAIRILKDTFHPRKPDEHYSLELRMKPRKSSFMSFGGFSSRYYNNSACLSHDHETQYTFVLQSLLLWREIMRNLPKLWQYADTDLLDQQYRLVDTGQGYHRLQSCPTVGAEMRRILGAVQRHCNGWVGLSVIHLGDRDVPNALVFIDKYTQVPRILAPLALCIDRLPALADDRAFHKYVSDEWGSINGLRMQILSDFFKHGFDGSGDDGGSCIDGRLTSAWNWCSKLHKKPYYHVFMFTGFQGFDGDWKDDA
mmetsp:Transcript_29387/g.28111  ORF Transcript_29387/g.28111 Transcript_29387/m.28111 type:complete len:602 (+) Transcript_29387:77-1882(+)